MRNLCICKILFPFKSYPLSNCCCVVEAVATLFAQRPPGCAAWWTCRNLFSCSCCQPAALSILEQSFFFCQSTQVAWNFYSAIAISIFQFAAVAQSVHWNAKNERFMPPSFCIYDLRVCVCGVWMCVSDRFYGHTFPCVFSRQIDPPTGPAGRQLSCSSSHSLSLSLCLSLSLSLPLSHIPSWCAVQLILTNRLQSWLRTGTGTPGPPAAAAAAAPRVALAVPISSSGVVFCSPPPPTPKPEISEILITIFGAALAEHFLQA